MREQDRELIEKFNREILENETKIVELQKSQRRLRGYVANLEARNSEFSRKYLPPVR